MNWGYKILLVIVVFMVGMLSMVYIASMQTNDLVETNYYSKELKYQSKIDASKNLAALTKNSIMDDNGDMFYVKLPISSFEQFEIGTVEFLKLDNKSQDKSFSFKPDSAGFAAFKKEGFALGAYKARISWTNAGKEFYSEETVVKK